MNSIVIREVNYGHLIISLVNMIEFSLIKLHALNFILNVTLTSIKCVVYSQEVQTK